MNDRFISTEYRTDCYHCRQLADQHIQAMPNRADVTCENCGATRVFVPRIEDVDDAGKFAGPGPWPVWSLAVEAACRNCGVSGFHDLMVSCRSITVRCRNCRFTHLYRFDLEYMADDPAGGRSAGVVPGHSGTCP
jgi:predicted nucleic-acid-binding Zn-ribbon protein